MLKNQVKIDPAHRQLMWLFSQFPCILTEYLSPSELSAMICASTDTADVADAAWRMQCQHLSKQKWREQNADKIKKWREENVDKIKAIEKKYRENNADKIKADRKTKYTFECGSDIYFKHKARHERTTKHIKFIEPKNEPAN
jgi:hypothetical protein